MKVRKILFETCILSPRHRPNTDGKPPKNTMPTSKKPPQPARCAGAVSSIGDAIVFGLSFSQFIGFFLWVVFVDCIGTGCIIGTALWWISNKFLRKKHTFAVEEKVEWAYAFDVHCNAFFPLLLVLHVLQMILLGVINHSWFASTAIADTLWLIALTYYFYITFLGYSSLPFLDTTVVFFLCPIILVVALYIIALLLNWNISRSVFRYYGLQED